MAGGRPRKPGKRTKSGQRKRSEMDKRDPDIKPTAELLRHKKASGGGEIRDPLSYIDLTNIQKQAVNLYFGLASAAGFGSKLKISSLNQRIGGTNVTSSPDDARDVRARKRYDEAREALSLAGPMCLSITDMIRGHQGKLKVEGAYLTALRDGANALAKHFKITN